MFSPFDSARAAAPARAAVRILACAVLLAACTTEQSPEAAPGTTAAEAAAADTALLTFTCSDTFRFTLMTAGPAATLFLPDTTLPLEQTAAATGRRYARAGVELWHDVHQATLDLHGTLHDGCRVQQGADPWTHARLRGVTFRAVGQEPGWVLDIGPDHVLNLITDYGERTLVMTADAPVSSNGVTTYRAITSDHALTVVMQPASCVDVMSGETFRWSVRVVLDGIALTGCGRRLD
jgi:uncharacterized membrane protein/membrane-bound inhibitor of C-type lysozyme